MRAIRGMHWNAFCGTRDDEKRVEHNAAAITKHLLILPENSRGETPHAALPMVSTSSAATFLWSLLDCYASQQWGLGWAGLLETLYYPNNDNLTCRCQEAAFWLTERRKEDGEMFWEKQQISWPHRVFTLVYCCQVHPVICRFTHNPFRNAGIHLYKATRVIY